MLFITSLSPSSQVITYAPFKQFIRDNLTLYEYNDKWEVRQKGTPLRFEQATQVAAEQASHALWEVPDVREYISLAMEEDASVDFIILFQSPHLTVRLNVGGDSDDVAQFNLEQPFTLIDKEKQRQKKKQQVRIITDPNASNIPQGHQREAEIVEAMQEAGEDIQLAPRSLDVKGIDAIWNGENAQIKRRRETTTRMDMSIKIYEDYDRRRSHIDMSSKAQYILQLSADRTQVYAYRMEDTRDICRRLLAEFERQNPALREQIRIPLKNGQVASCQLLRGKDNQGNPVNKLFAYIPFAGMEMIKVIQLKRKIKEGSSRSWFSKISKSTKISNS